MEIAAIIFVLIGFGIAYIVFRLLKKTLKLMLRALVVLLLMVITMAGGIYLWTSDGAGASKKSTKTR